MRWNPIDLAADMPVGKSFVPLFWSKKRIVHGIAFIIIILSCSFHIFCVCVCVCVASLLFPLQHSFFRRSVRFDIYGTVWGSCHKRIKPDVIISIVITCVMRAHILYIYKEWNALWCLFAIAAAVYSFWWFYIGTCSILSGWKKDDPKKNARELVKTVFIMCLPTPAILAKFRLYAITENFHT